MEAAIDQEVQQFVNNQDMVGGLRYLCDEGSFFALGKCSRFEELTYYYMGSDREFPRDSELPIDEIRTAAKEFLESGGARPAPVQWSGVG